MQILQHYSKSHTRKKIVHLTSYMLMKMEKEIISSENIKPSSPTPPHLKTHNLSLFDQIVPPIFLPVVLYFSASENSSPENVNEFVSQTTPILRRSLSATLTRFYPLAGRIRDGLSIDCNDEGVLFVVSKVTCNLSDFLKNPNKTESQILIPCELTWSEPAPGTQVLMIQVNYFACGAIAIGSLFYHKLTDGVTISTFLKAWAASARGFAETELPNYTAGCSFPHNKAMQSESHLFSIMKQYFKIGKTSMRRYVFDSSAISTLRAKLTSHGGLEFRPSRVQIVSALIWKCFMVALSTSGNASSKQKSLVNHAVNVRRKANPSFPEHSFGNFVWLAPSSSANKTDIDMKDLVRTMRNSINKIDSSYVTRMQGDHEGFSGYQQNVEDSWKEFHENAEYLGISSWCNFGLYNVVDFGWGKPLWITGCNAESDKEYPFLNMVWLMDTREGNGIEAWVYLDEQYFAAFDNNQELQALASVDPSPLDIASTFKKSVLINGHP